MATRPYQAVVWGATGFVGQLVCERLAREYPNRLRLAMAGRDRRKLERIRRDLTSVDDGFENVDILIADAQDSAKLESIAESTEVVISCAGPYRKYSSQMVAACVNQGANYVDLTAEIPWVRENIRSFHEAALEKGVKIVHFCGFDSMPMDLGTLTAVETIRERYQTGCRSVELYMTNAMGGGSGGTIASLIDMSTSADQFERAAMDDPYCLRPQHLSSLSGKKFEGIQFNRDMDIWNVPTPFSWANIPVVYRSAALAKQSYGKDFTYRDGFRAPNFPLALAASLFNGFFSTTRDNTVLQNLVRNVSPPPGSGPSRELMKERGFWELFCVGYSEDASQPPVTVKLGDKQGDPGYWSTSKMLLECGLSMILDSAAVERGASLAGGVLTPATALGRVPLMRLKESGFTVDIDP